MGVTRLVVLGAETDTQIHAACPLDMSLCTKASKVITTANGSLWTSNISQWQGSSWTSIGAEAGQGYNSVTFFLPIRRSTCFDCACAGQKYIPAQGNPQIGPFCWPGDQCQERKWPCGAKSSSGFPCSHNAMCHSHIHRSLHSQLYQMAALLLEGIYLRGYHSLTTAAKTYAL